MLIYYGHNSTSYRKKEWIQMKYKIAWAKCEENHITEQTDPETEQEIPVLKHNLPQTRIT